MSNGSEVDNTQITSNQVRAPNFLNEPIQNAAAGANNAFSLGHEGFNQTAGRNLVGQQLRGDFLSPDSNPFLQATFDRGADAIQNRLDTQFAGSGRNIGASIAPAKADLSDFATSLFGGNFQNERNIQQNSLNQVSQFDPINQLINRIGLLSPAAGRDTNQTVYGNTEESPGVIDSILGFL